MLQAYPRVFIAAECEEELRQLVLAHSGLKKNGKWIKLDGGIYGIYANEIRRLLFNDCFILREAAVLGKDCKWIIISGSLSGAYICWNVWRILWNCWCEECVLFDRSTCCMVVCAEVWSRLC